MAILWISDKISGIVPEKLSGVDFFKKWTHADFMLTFILIKYWRDLTMITFSSDPMLNTYVAVMTAQLNVALVSTINEIYKKDWFSMKFWNSYV